MVATSVRRERIFFKGLQLGGQPLNNQMTSKALFSDRTTVKNMQTNKIMTVLKKFS